MSTAEMAKACTLADEAGARTGVAACKVAPRDTRTEYMADQTLGAGVWSKVSRSSCAEAYLTGSSFERAGSTRG